MGRIVYLDGRLLKPRKPAGRPRPQSDDVYNWGFEGGGPLRLAYAVLSKTVGNKATAELYQLFMKTFIASLPSHDFNMEIELRKWIEHIKEYMAGNAPPATLDMFRTMKANLFYESVQTGKSQVLKSANQSPPEK